MFITRNYIGYIRFVVKTKNKILQKKFTIFIVTLRRNMRIAWRNFSHIAANTRILRNEEISERRPSLAGRFVTQREALK